MEKASLDLQKLALERTATTAEAGRYSSPSRWRWVLRYLLPSGILMAFVALVMAAAGKQLFPARGVTVVPVIVKRGESVSAGEPVFQAPGWIEPRPTAISVTAMTPGVIEELMVVAGQKLRKGDPIAQLIAIDAELAVEQARNGLAISEGELNRANAELTAARVRLEQPVHLQALLADAHGELARAQTELAKLPFQIRAAESDVTYAESSLENKRMARQALSENVVAIAQRDYAITQANLEELKQRGPHLEREILALQEKAEATAKQLELLVDEHRQVQEAEAKVQSAMALRDEAKLRLRQAELALERTVVRSPLDGQVLRLVASPGTRLMGLEGASAHGASTVIEMFDPGRLQVRVDVRLEDIPLVRPGQLVEIETASSPDVISGRVLQITSEANIQKNTLEVKVELLDPPATVGPEMLVTATFLAPMSERATGTSQERERVFIPETLVQMVDGNPSVWIVDDQSMARTRSIQIGSKADAELVEVKSGLQVTDKLIVTGTDGLKDGTLVKIVGDDPRLGVN